MKPGERKKKVRRNHESLMTSGDIYERYTKDRPPRGYRVEYDGRGDWCFVKKEKP